MPKAKKPLPGDQHVLEELACPPAGTAVHVASIALFEPQSGPLQDRRVELAPVVDHDHDRRSRLQSPPHVRKHGGDPVAIGRERLAARALAELELAELLQSEQLVGVAMLLVIVDQARVGRRGEHPVEAGAEVELARVAVQDFRGPAPRAHA